MEDKMIKAGKISDIPEGEGRVFRVNQNEIAIFRLESGMVAIDNRCPHSAGPLSDGIVAGDLVVCPLHGHKFNLKTGESVGDDKGVRTYPVLVNGDQIIIEKAGA